MDMVDKFITTYPDWFNYSNNQICELIMQNEFYKINEQHILKQQEQEILAKTINRFSENFMDKQIINFNDCIITIPFNHHFGYQIEMSSGDCKVDRT